jgi:hypothetical protein
MIFLYGLFVGVILGAYILAWTIALDDARKLREELTRK